MCDQLQSNSSEDHDDVDNPIIYVRKFDEYGLKILDGGSSFIMIYFCPWCGEKLPPSRRDQWFDELEKIGFKDPFGSDELPQKYLTDEWYKAEIY